MQYSKDKFADIPNTIQDTDIIQDITLRLKPLKTYLAKYANLNIPISFDDDSNICNTWGTYKNKKYIANDNACTIVDNTGTRKCLTKLDNTLASCDKIYVNGTLNTANTINIDNIYNIAYNNMITKYKKLINTISSASADLDIKVVNSSQYTDLANAQSTLINNNIVGLTDKKQNYNTNLDILQSKMDKVNIERINYQQFLQNKANTDARIILYKKIVLGLIITLLVLFGLIYIMSNVL